MEEKFYTVQDVADKLSFTARGVQKWIREGKLPALKFGREYRIRESALLEFIKQHETASK